MKNKKRSMRIICLLMSLVFAFPTYAQKGNKLGVIGVEDISTEISLFSSDISEIMASPRGRLISQGVARVSDEGGGLLGVYAQTSCHTDVKQIKMKIYIDVLDANTDDWYTVDMYEYNWYNTDFTDNKLFYASASFNVSGLDRGEQYRVRCNHYVYELGTSVYEVLTSRTAFIPLD